MGLPSDRTIIRRAGAHDAPLLTEFGRRTFVEAFGAANDPHDLTAYLAATYTIERQTDELRNPDTVYLVAEHGGEVAGFALVRVGRAPPCVTGPAPIELQRIYVDRPWHGHGIAQRLMQAVEHEARARGGRTLWLGVWEHNPRAIAFYRKCGFVDVGQQTFQLGSDVQTDRVLMKPLSEGPSPTGAG